MLSKKFNDFSQIAKLMHIISNHEFMEKYLLTIHGQNTVGLIEKRLLAANNNLSITLTQYGITGLASVLGLAGPAGFIIGGVLGFFSTLLGFFRSSPSVWDQVKANVEHYVQQQISQLKFYNLHSLIESIYIASNTYFSNIPNTNEIDNRIKLGVLLGMYMQNICTFAPGLNTSNGTCSVLNQNDIALALPFLVPYANAHIIVSKHALDIGYINARDLQNTVDNYNSYFNNNAYTSTITNTSSMHEQLNFSNFVSYNYSIFSYVWTYVAYNYISTRYPVIFSSVASDLGNTVSLDNTLNAIYPNFMSNYYSLLSQIIIYYNNNGITGIKTNAENGFEQVTGISFSDNNMTININKLNPVNQIIIRYIYDGSSVIALNLIYLDGTSSGFMPDLQPSGYSDFQAAVSDTINVAGSTSTITLQFNVISIQASNVSSSLGVCNDICIGFVPFLK